MITGLVTLVAGSLLVPALFHSTDNSQVQSTHFSEFKIIHTAKKCNFRQKVIQDSCFLGKDATVS